ncbi:MAG: hypothetical protein BWK73_49045 [Thiothrix lacustris]|uniref:histidine kinase n=1 Tax=Thiothrix lacustris TaxID=525917 RepID=A0A1Y1Q9A6_9GAMM|nr:MAG: hypothetical protein BWK73_49045 [Thiothrix lacustris]
MLKRIDVMKSHLTPLIAVIVCLLLWLMPTSVSAQPALSLLADPNRQLSIEQVSSAAYAERFQASGDTNAYNRLIYNTSAHVWWLRLEIDSQSHQNGYLRINTPTIAQLDAFIVDPSTQQIQRLGNLRKNGIGQRVPLLKLPSAAGSHYWVYLRASNQGLGIITLPVQFLSTDELTQQTARDYWFYGGILIGLLVLASYNLFLFGSLRNWSYLTLALFLLSLVLVLQRTHNVVPWLAPVANPDSFWFTACFQLLLISALQLWRQLIDSKHLLPVADKVFQVLLLLTASLMLFSGVSPYNTDKGNFLLSAASILFGFFYGILALREGLPIVRSFALGLFVFLGSALPITLWGVGLLAAANAQALIDIFNLGVLLTAILLSFTLAEHTRQLRIQAERAAAENQTKDAFLTTMSHELRTPMNSVMAATALLQQSPHLPAREQEYVTHMATASQHMLKLIDNILDMSRLKQITAIPRVETFHLPTLLDNLQQMLVVQATAKHLSLHIQQPDNQERYLQGDPQYLSQVLVNLLGNAIKFTERGKVELSIREVAGSSPDRVLLYFAVTDTGIGIAVEDQQRLFTPFTQLEDRRTRHHKGSGLGLAISQQLVTAMGGKLELDSTPEQGSRFFFTLEFPLDTPHTAAANNDSAPALGVAALHPPCDGNRILLVDDDAMNRFFGQQLLQQLGINATTADSGANAIEQLQHQNVDLVFMDVSMPGMDGYETTRRIRTDPRFVALPIIALTAHAIDGERERCLAAGMNDYLTKPFGQEQIHRILQQWIIKGGKGTHIAQLGNIL